MRVSCGRFFKVIFLALLCFFFLANDGVGQLPNGTVGLHRSTVVAVARTRRGRVYPDFPGIILEQTNRKGFPLVRGTNGNDHYTDLALGVIVLDNGDVLTTDQFIDDPAMNDYWVIPQFQGNSDSARTSVRPLPAQVRASDPWTGLGILRAESLSIEGEPGFAEELIAAPFVGQKIFVWADPVSVLRNGRALRASGFVRALHRQPSTARTLSGLRSGLYRKSLAEYGTLLQVQADTPTISRGGLVLSENGSVIGLGSGTEGLVIPLDGPVRSVIKILADGKLPEFGFLGVEPIDYDARATLGIPLGALIRRVVPGFPADVAGLRAGEVVIAADGTPIESATELFREMSRRCAQTSVRLTVVRGDDAGDERPLRYVTVVLGKKHLETHRTGYAIQRPFVWRGMQVEWSTAMPPDRIFARDFQLGPVPPVAVGAVDLDSPAWKSGLRPWMQLLSFDELNVHSPAEFQQLAERASGDVIIRALGDNGHPLVVTVPH
jgi:S1-C subfamily serine protease